MAAGRPQCRGSRLLVAIALLLCVVMSGVVARPAQRELSSSLAAQHGRTLLQETDGASGLELEVEPDDIEDESLLDAPAPAPEEVAPAPAPAATLADAPVTAADSPTTTPAATPGPDVVSGLSSRAPPPPSFAALTPSPAQVATPPPPPPYVNTIGSLVSYVDPPTGVSVPALSPAAKAAEANLTGWYTGLETINANRQYTTSTAQSLNCGTGYLNSHFQKYFAAIPVDLWYDGKLCGACVNVTCVDTTCPTPFTTNGLFMIVDSCEGCEGHNIVLSAAGIGEVTTVNYNNNPSLQVAWEFASCSSLIEGGIKMLPHARNSKYFVGINFSNLQQLLYSVTISGITMTYQDYGYWVIDTPGTVIPLSPPYTLRLVSNSREVLTIRIPSLTALDLGVNFSEPSS